MPISGRGNEWSTKLLCLAAMTTAGWGAVALPALAADGGRIVAAGPQVRYGDRVVLGRGASIAAEMATGGELRPTVDGVSVTPRAWASGWAAGPHELGGVVVSPDGSEALLETLPILSDTSPPEIQWEVGTTEIFERHGLDQGVDRDRPPRKLDPRAALPIGWSPDGRRWVPLLPKGEERAEWQVLSDRPQVFLWVVKKKEVRVGEILIHPRQVLRVWSEDEISAVRELLLVAERTGPRSGRVTLVARDLVGNEALVEWAVAEE